MAVLKKVVKACKCERCSNEWLPRDKKFINFDSEALPACCPKCHSPYWNKPRILKRKKK